MPQNEPGIDEEFVPEFTIRAQRKNVRNCCQQPVDTQPNKNHNKYNNEIGVTLPLAEELIAGPIEFDS
jgi:hypothetical protein